jgi:hypothetical protein
MKNAARQVYLLLRESASKTPHKFAKYKTAETLGISPEALNSQLLWLARSGFISCGLEDRVDVIEVRAVPPAPTAYVKRDFRGNNLHLNKFSGVCVLRLQTIDGPSFSERLDNWSWGKPLQGYVSEETRVIEARLAPFVSGEAKSNKLVRLYWRLFSESCVQVHLEEYEQGLLLTSLYGSPTSEVHRLPNMPPKSGLFHSPHALTSALTTLEAARLIYRHHPAMAIAVFPPCEERALGEDSDWEKSCVRAVDRWLLEHGLANRVAALIGWYHKLLDIYGVPWGYEPGIWAAAKDLQFGPIHITGFDVDQLLEYFVRFQHCGTACDHGPHLAVRDRVPPTLSGLRDHIYVVYEQVLHSLGRIDDDGLLLSKRFVESDEERTPFTPADPRQPTTVKMIRKLDGDWKRYLGQRRKTKDPKEHKRLLGELRQGHLNASLGEAC